MNFLPILATALLSGAMTMATAQTATQPGPSRSADGRPQDNPNASVSAEQLAKVKSVLAAYKPASLSVDDAKAIKRALRDAGMRRSPALDAAITAAGFSPERLETLDPAPARPPGEGEGPGGPPPRK
jgi:hypothetical protein